MKMLSVARLKTCQPYLMKSQYFYWIQSRYATAGCSTFEDKELTTELKHKIERHWKDKLPSNKFDENNTENKFFVVPMFPYPSGNLHMGHVRVYTISDTIARFHRLNGKNVLHPMGWDAFGLPAENAAKERKIPSEKWTKDNIAQMKEQLDRLGCSFDWSREISTCNPDYYKWTQWIFLQMFREGMAYQQLALVNWDPVDETVLANEQVDANGCGWRSGAKVIQKPLKQWFLQTSRYNKQLLDDLELKKPSEWPYIIKIQKNWIGDCNGYKFLLDLFFVNDAIKKPLKSIFVWTKTPEELENAGFIAIRQDHLLNESGTDCKLLDVAVQNPFNPGELIPLIVYSYLNYPPGCDTYIGVPSIKEKDADIAKSLSIHYDKTPPTEKNRETILKKARQLNKGGYLVSSTHQDWLISRQRFWGTPIPIIHCQHCGTIPVRESDLPVLLPETNLNKDGSSKKLEDMPEWRTVKCYKCGNEHAQRETDTMDTFMDSSWYFLRFLDPHNKSAIFNKKIASNVVPVDLYVGGKEHAMLHLYYARFIQHFLHHLKLLPEKEPFKALLPQGMVLARTFQDEETGRYLPQNEVTIVNEKKKKAIETATGNSVSMDWSKMSKSKGNGVVPIDEINEFGADTIRLIMLADIGPKVPRKWARDSVFVGITRWENCLWRVLRNFNDVRENGAIPPIDPENRVAFDTAEKVLKDKKNRCIGNSTRFIATHALAAAFKEPQKFVNLVLTQMPETVIKYSAEYERSIFSLLIVIAPFAPNFASELWSKFLSIPNRIDHTESEIDWNKDVLEQKWPKPDGDFQVSFDILVHGTIVDNSIIYTVDELQELTKEKAVELALNQEIVQKHAKGRTLNRFKFRKECVVLSIDLTFDKNDKKKVKKKKKTVDDEEEEEEDDDEDIYKSK